MSRIHKVDCTHKMSYTPQGELPIHKVSLTHKVDCTSCTHKARATPPRWAAPLEGLKHPQGEPQPQGGPHPQGGPYPQGGAAPRLWFVTGPLERSRIRHESVSGRYRSVAGPVEVFDHLGDTAPAMPAPSRGRSKARRRVNVQASQTRYRWPRASNLDAAAQSNLASCSPCQRRERPLEA
jgi:hypothetical protein